MKGRRRAWGVAVARIRTAAMFWGALLVLACADDPASPADPDIFSHNPTQCSIPQNRILSGGLGKDAIPALTNPSFVPIGDPGLDYLRFDDRVVGLVLRSGPIAIPLNIFWWHEVVNLDGIGHGMVITHCPLTGSSMAFDRSPVAGIEFGVSGLLYKNNLIMYDRDEQESLWPQMMRGARCGVRDGAELPMVPVLEMAWSGWKALFPETRVVSGNTGYEMDYGEYPYVGYDNPDDPTFLFPANVDPRRPPKERTLGIPSGSGGIAFPFGLLDELGAVATVRVEFEGQPLVVFWNRFSQAAMAFVSTANQEILTFSVVNGKIMDDQTGSLWRADGLANEGPLAGHRLEPVDEAFVAFWFAWPEFYPDIAIWTELP